MHPKLTDEQREAIHQASGPVPVEDELTGQLYFLIDRAMLDRLRQEAVREAVRKGLADTEAGRLLTLDNLNAQVPGRTNRRPPT